MLETRLKVPGFMLGNFPQTARTFTIVPSVREPFEDGPRPGAVGDW